MEGMDLRLMMLGTFSADLCPQEYTYVVTAALGVCFGRLQVLDHEPLYAVRAASAEHTLESCWPDVELRLEARPLVADALVSSSGRQARNLPSTKIVRRLWKARNQAQDKAMARLQGGAARPTRDADALTALFGAEPAGEVYSRLEKRRAVSKKALFAQLPNHVEVEVPSAQAGVNSVSFVVARDKPECLVAIQASKQSLTTLLEEVTAERTGTEDEEPGSPRTPPRRPGKRRTHPFASSPGSGQSPGSRGGRKRARRPESHFDKDRGRVVARWREADGSWNHRFEKLLRRPSR